MECIYTIGTSSTSHTYGNVASCIREMLLTYFPRNFFTYVHVESKLAWKNIKEVLGNGDAEIKKRQYPFLMITPRFSNGNYETDRYLANIPLTENVEPAMGGLRRNTLHPILMDQKHSIEVAYKLNRDRIEFEVELRLKSLSQQLDVFKNLYNTMMWNIPHTKTVALESMIPRSMIEYVGKIAGIDITQSTDENNQIPLIMRYLNSYSRYPITYKIKTMSAVEEFFLYYKTNLLLTFSDLSTSDPVKKNSVDEYASITFRVTVEFNLPGLYALIGTHERQYHGLRFDAMVRSTDSVEIIPMYTFTNLYDRIDTGTPDGLSFYSSTIVQTEKENAGKDEIIDMREVIPADHMRILDLFLRDSIPPETIFRFRLLENSRELPCNEGMTAPDCAWRVDWKRKRIVIHHSDPLVTYRLLIYANMVQINERYGQLQDITKRDRPQFT